VIRGKVISDNKGSGMISDKRDSDQ
jgi:hypothetical protein